MFNHNKRTSAGRSKNTNVFLKTYGLSLFITIFFSAVIFQMLFFRASPALPLANVLDGFTSIGSGYNALAHNATDQTLTDQVPGSSLSESTSQTPQLPSTASRVADVETGAAFGVAIAAFHQEGTKLSCSGNNHKRSNCSKQYSFSAVVRVVHGPGTVAYGWLGTLPQEIESGKFSSSKDETKTLSKTVTLTCESPTKFTIQFVTTEPADAHSQVLTTTHNCNELDH